MTTPRYCAVIPIYNHGQTISGVVDAIGDRVERIYLVDDGSDEECARAIDHLAAENTLVVVLRRRCNGGKGAAVMDGLRCSIADGMTHALQIDADGQHDSADIPRFIAMSRNHPAAVVCGVPCYDQSVPKGRLYGRYATHIWVWIETLSFSIRDSMCGFRVYPLDSLMPLLQRVRFGQRMEFDIEVMVHLHWANTPLINLPTAVTYPVGGLSHFRPLTDNLRISWSHTRLVIGMLWRLPRLIANRLVR